MYDPRTALFYFPMASFISPDHNEPTSRKFERSRQPIPRWMVSSWARHGLVQLDPVSHDMWHCHTTTEADEATHTDPPVLDGDPNATHDEDDSA